MSEVAGVPIVDVGAVVLVALVLGALFGRLRLSTAVGYILAGVLLGPLGLHYLVPGQGLAPAFGELGLLMLLFYLGLELSLKRLRETGAVASLLAFLEMVVAFAVGFAVAKLFGLGDLESLVIAAMLPATSTVHAVDFILERGLRARPEARLAESALVLQDFAAILVVVFLSALGAHRALNVAALNALLFVVAAFFLVSQVSKRALAFLESIKQSDKMALYAIGVGIGVAYFGVFLGLEAGIGAYFAGFALAETIYGERIKRELRFLREFFILFFFVSFGAELFVDPASGLVLLPGGGQLAFLAALALALLATYVLAKVFAYAAFGTALGLSGESALTVGALMMPIGEFALIIAAAARPLLAPEVYQVVFSLAFVLVLATAVATPLLYARVHSLAGLFARFYPPLLQRTMRNGAARLAGVEALLHDRVLHTEWWRTARSLFLNLLLAISIVYLSNVIRVEVVLPLLPFVPASIGIGALILPLVAWPVYRIIVELRFLTHAVAERFFAAAFPLLARRHSLEHQVSEVFTGLLLTAVGVLASAGVYYAFPQDRLFLLLPALYTLLSLMFFSKALYGSLEEFAVAEATLAAGEGPLAGDPRLRRLSLEFNERARRFQQLHLDRTLAREQIQEALLGGDAERARRLLFDFRQREAQHAAHLAGRPSPALGRPSRPRAPAPRESLEALLFAGAASRKPARRPARKPERARAAAKKPARRGRLKTKRG